MHDLTQKFGHNERRARNLLAGSWDSCHLCDTLLDDKMSLPNPELHTYFDEEQGERIYYSCEQMAFDIDGDVLVVVPPLFLSDGLSIPRLFRSIFSKSPSYIYAGIAHDYTYRILPHKMTRKQADKLFLKLMRGYGVGWSRRLIYRAVRLGAKKNWRARFPQFATTNHHD